MATTSDVQTSTKRALIQELMTTVVDDSLEMLPSFTSYEHHLSCVVVLKFLTLKKLLSCLPAFFLLLHQPKEESFFPQRRRWRMGKWERDTSNYFFAIISYKERVHFRRDKSKGCQATKQFDPILLNKVLSLPAKRFLCTSGDQILWRPLLLGSDLQDLMTFCLSESQVRNFWNSRDNFRDHQKGLPKFLKYLSKVEIFS